MTSNKKTEVIWGVADQSKDISKTPIIFSPTDPYPQINFSTYSYPQAQAHAKEVDAWLGLNIREVEYKLQLKSQSDFEKREQWIGLDPAALLTPYIEIRRILDLLAPQPGQKIIDLGAGYARMAFVIAAHYPGVSFVGYEIAEERVKEGNRILLKIFSWQRLSPPNEPFENLDPALFHFPGKVPPTIKLVEQDLSKMNFIIGANEESLADYYFIYDFGTLNSIKKALLDLQDLSRTRKITVIGRGRACRDQIERHEPWLSQIVKPEHHGNFSIYRS
jgi:hypothetical protein